ncbi:MAG: alpha/beta fold hydrolase [Rhizobiales bacterium]|nr:alpha/beta fold hydrolase [Hyphomicrobiales bacterium]
MAQVALKVIRPLVKASSFLSPGLTGRLAFRLFCTPIGRTRPNRQSANFKRTEALFAKARVQTVSYGCGFVRSFTFEPDSPSRGTVLMLHGWTGEAITMAGFIETMLERGFRVIAPDLPAHGGSSGRQLTFPLAMQALNALLRTEKPLAGIVAHSFGGSIGMAAMAGGIAAVPAIVPRRFVSIAAPSTMQVYGRQFSDMLGLTRRGHRAFEDKVLRIAGRPMESFSGREFLAQSRVPSLIIHAQDDKEIPFSDAEDLASAGEHVRLMSAKGHGHRRILLSKDVHAATADFLES